MGKSKIITDAMQDSGKWGIDLTQAQNRFLVTHETVQRLRPVPFGDLNTALESAYNLAKQAVKSMHPEVYVLDTAEGTCCRLQVI